MENRYSIDLSAILLDDLQTMLKTKYLLPSRKIVLDDIEQRFSILKQLGINNALELTQVLKSKLKIEQCATQTGIPSEYLTILKRETSSYENKPIKLSDLPDIKPQTIKKLEQVGIKNTKHFFEKSLTKNTRQQLADSLNIPQIEITELACMSDLARISGVGPTFTKILIDGGITSVSKIMSKNPDELLEKVTGIMIKNDVKPLLTSKDIDYIYETARLLPKGIQ